MAWTLRHGRLGRDRRSALVRSAEDPDAFREFYEAYAERVVVFFTRRTLDAELALDLTGETFAVALERRRQFRGASEEEEQAWLFAIARSQISRYWRRGAVERDALWRLGLDPPAATAADIERIEELADLEGLRVLLEAAFAGLSEDQAYCVRARVLGERSYAELADELGVSEQVVRARVSRGLRGLESALAQVGEAT